MKLQQTTTVARGNRMNTGLRAVAVAAAGVLMMGASMTAKADISLFTPSAYAESKLFVTNFRILDASTGFSASTVVSPNIAGTTLDSSVSSNLSGSASALGVQIFPLQSPAQSVSHFVSNGPGAVNYGGTNFDSFLSGTMDDGVFAGAASVHSGNGLQLNLQPTTTAKTQAVVNVKQGGGILGNADSSQDLKSSFILTTQGAALLDVYFDAAAFLRVALGQPLINADASRNWTLTVRAVGSTANLVSWTPNGEEGGTSQLGGLCSEVLGECTELSDDFSLNFGDFTNVVADISYTQSGEFGLRVGLAPNTTYQFVINHTTSANASTAVPEPGSLALVGAAMLGLVGIRRRFNKA